MIRACAALIACVIVVSVVPVSAQTIGYAEGIDRLARACGGDINKYCRTASLGGGRVLACLERGSGVSANCRAATAEVRVLIQARAQARANVLKVCAGDVRRWCDGVQSGDGNLMECFSKAKPRFSAECQAAVRDAGYE